MQDRPEPIPPAAAGSPMLDAAWSAERIGRLFNERILPELAPGVQLIRAEPKRTLHERSGSCVVLYRLHADPASSAGARELPPLATVTFSDAWEPSESAAPPDSAARATQDARDGDPPSVLALPELGMLVELFPSDPRLPGLRTAARPERMHELLERLHGDGGPTRRWSCTPLRHHPRVRCVLLYEREGDRARRLVGKVFAKPKRAARAWATLQALFGASARARHWRAPTPLHYDAELRLVLMEWLPGDPLGRLLGRGGDAGLARPLVRRAARALAELHREGGDAWEPRSAALDRSKTRRRAERIGRTKPRLAARIAALLDAIEERSGGLAIPRTTLLHGSAAPNQLLLDGERLSIVDLDGVACGDPAIDVGSFLAALSKLGCDRFSRGDVESLAEGFLEEYRAAHPEDGELVLRASLIRCQELVNHAARGFLKRSALSAGEDVPPATERVLREVECHLAIR